jgi:hypothetical protein
MIAVVGLGCTTLSTSTQAVSSPFYVDAHVDTVEYRYDSTVSSPSSIVAFFSCTSTDFCKVL